jgi:hypothetical protein
MVCLRNIRVNTLHKGDIDDDDDDDYNNSNNNSFVQVYRRFRRSGQLYHQRRHGFQQVISSYIATPRGVRNSKDGDVSSNIRLKPLALRQNPRLRDPSTLH